MKLNSKMNCIKGLILLSLMLSAFIVRAVEVTDLYQAQVVVVSQAVHDRNVAIKNAMQAVLLKVGGQQDILSNKVIMRGLRNYQQYLVQFSYQNTRNDKTGNIKQFLLASFNEEKINQLFSQAHLSLWGNLRPQVLLWLVDENGLTRSVISESSTSTIPAEILKFSRVSGLPISLPLMDLTDINAITTADIWGRFAAPVKLASSRYQAEAYVIMRLSNSSLLPELNVDDNCDLLCRKNSYVLDWRLFTESQQASNIIPDKYYHGNNINQLITEALTDVTQQIYQFYALNFADNHQIEIEVANINTMVRYVKVIDFLKGLSSVDAVQLISAQGENRRFRLNLLGSKQSLLASLRLNKQLQQYIDPLAKFSADDVPVFYWGKR